MHEVTKILTTYGLSVFIFILFIFFFFNKNSPKTYKKPWALIGALVMAIAIVLRLYMQYLEAQPRHLDRIPEEPKEIIGPVDPQLK